MLGGKEWLLDGEELVKMQNERGLNVCVWGELIVTDECKMNMTAGG